jgi:hypothetical protein
MITASNHLRNAHLGRLFCAAQGVQPCFGGFSGLSSVVQIVFQVYFFPAFDKMSWFSRTKNRLTDQPFGFYVNLSSFPRLVLLILVVLPVFLGIWYLWAQLLGFWMVKVDSIVEPEPVKVQGFSALVGSTTNAPAVLEQVNATTKEAVQVEKILSTTPMGTTPAQQLMTKPFVVTTQEAITTISTTVPTVVIHINDETTTPEVTTTTRKGLLATTTLK